MSQIVNPSKSSAPGGADKAVQFNDAGSFGGVPELWYDKATQRLTAPIFSGPVGGAETTIVTGTAPGADTQSVLVAGSGSISSGRGGYFYACGNQKAGNPGRVGMIPGTATGAAIELMLSSGAFAFRIDGVKGGLQFPAVGVENSDPTTLDDYQERLWTPGIASYGGSSGVSYSSQAARAVKIGSLVSVFGIVSLSVKGTHGPGSIVITGLPFPVAGATYATGAVNWFGLANPYTTIIGIAMPGSIIDLRGQAYPPSGAGSNNGLTGADLTSSSGFTFGLQYVTV